MGKRAIWMVLAAVMLMAAGCATEYQARGFLGDGYSSVRLDATTHKVVYECNEFTNEAACDGFLFRRCAELTVETGYDWFEMTEHRSVIREKLTTVPGHYNMVTTGSGRDKTTTYVYSPPYTQSTKFPVCTATIKVSKGTKPEGGRNVFDAREVLKSVVTDTES